MASFSKMLPLGTVLFGSIFGCWGWTHVKSSAFCFGVIGRFHFSRFGGYVVILVLAGLFDFGSGFCVFIGGTFCLGWFVYF